MSTQVADRQETADFGSLLAAFEPAGQEGPDTEQLSRGPARLIVQAPIVLAMIIEKAQDLPEPWHRPSAEHASALECEAAAEIGPGHELSGRALAAMLAGMTREGLEAVGGVEEDD